MPKVERIKKARKPQGRCGKCGTEIKRGDPYVTWAFRYGGKRVRCNAPSCYPQASDLTNSPYLSEGNRIAEEYGRISGEPEEMVEAARTALADLEAEAVQKIIRGAFPVVYCNRLMKDDACRAQGIEPDLWLDDKPETIRLPLLAAADDVL